MRAAWWQPRLEEARRGGQLRGQFALSRTEHARSTLQGKFTPFRTEHQFERSNAVRGFCSSGIRRRPCLIRSGPAVAAVALREVVERVAAVEVGGQVVEEQVVEEQAEARVVVDAEEAARAEEPEEVPAGPEARVEPVGPEAGVEPAARAVERAVAAEIRDLEIRTCLIRLITSRGPSCRSFRLP